MEYSACMVNRWWVSPTYMLSGQDLQNGVYPFYYCKIHQIY
jgi:hypothetical protein